MKRLGLFLLIAVFAVPLLAHADTVGSVSLNTSAISGGTFTLLFQLTDGSGTLDANNTLTITGLDFGAGGSASGAATLSGGASGDSNTGFSLTDSDFYNAAEQQFVAGSALTFTFDLTGNPDLFAPDEFSFSIEEILTQDTFGGALLVIDVGSAPTTYAALGNGNASDNIGSPTLSTPTSNVPEPSSMLLLGCGLLGLKLRRRRAR